jgi:hypothetical protein
VVRSAWRLTPVVLPVVPDFVSVLLVRFIWFSCSFHSVLLFAVFWNRADSHVLIQFTPALRVRSLVTPADAPQINLRFSVGLLPIPLIASIIAPVSTGLLSLLALSVIEAKPL